MEHPTIGLGVDVIHPVWMNGEDDAAAIDLREWMNAEDGVAVIVHRVWKKEEDDVAAIVLRVHLTPV